MCLSYMCVSVHMWYMTAWADKFLCADWTSVTGCVRCVWAVDECLFNQSVSVGTQSDGLLTTIWSEREEQMREKTLSHSLGVAAKQVKKKKMDVASRSL